MGVAVRRYYRTPAPRRRLPGVVAGAVGRRAGSCPATAGSSASATAPSNVGLGLLNTSKAFQNVDYRGMLKRWLRAACRRSGASPRRTRPVPIRGAALPMGFNRQPHYTRGPAAGRRRRRHGQPVQRRGHRLRDGVRPAGGRDHRAGARPRRTPAQRERALHELPACLEGPAYGGYFTLGRMFVQAIGNPRVMKFATAHGLPHPTLMRFTLKLLANLTDPGAATRWTASSTRCRRWLRRHERRDLQTLPRRVRSERLRHERPRTHDHWQCGHACRRKTYARRGVEMDLYVPIIVLGVLAFGFAVFSVVIGLAHRARSAGTGRSSTPTSAASSRRRSRSAAAASR